MPTRGAITREGAELVYWNWPGADPPALLLHGIGNYGRYWDLFADAIAGRLRLVAPDARGHGESGRPPGGYAPADFAADALTVLDANGIDRAVVVGHSMGGLHSIHLAAHHPDRLRALAIVDASSEPLPEGAERAQRLLTGRPPRFADRTEARAYLERTSPGYSSAVYENRLAWAFREEAGGLVWRSDQNALERIMTARTPREDRWDALASIDCPALVVRGTRSNVLSDEAARSMVRTLRDGRLLELDAGHNVPLDRPRELADEVVALARH
ncbi:MAG TPA: alpha/beta hydrolase [Candidatus Limnocylindria bacterium]|jgi:pimeloyl-ACP methyl ester carboxylesterase|nr:alpha/beta hydrolase [Candidatus Limnocylindria bacterium]